MHLVEQELHLRERALAENLPRNNGVYAGVLEREAEQVGLDNIDAPACANVRQLLGIAVERNRTETLRLEMLDVAAPAAARVENERTGRKQSPQIGKRGIRHIEELRLGLTDDGENLDAEQSHAPVGRGRAFVAFVADPTEESSSSPG